MHALEDDIFGEIAQKLQHVMHLRLEGQAAQSNAVLPDDQGSTYSLIAQPIAGDDVLLTLRRRRLLLLREHLLLLQQIRQ